MSSSTNEPTPDWRCQRSVRRFPENNSSNDSSNVNPMKNEQQIHSLQSWSNRENEHGERKMNSLLSSSLMNSSHNRAQESSTNNLLYKRIHSNSPPNTPGEDASFNQLIKHVSLQSKSNKVLIANVFTETDSVSTALGAKTTATDTIQNKETFVKRVLQNGEYLLKYNSWHEFRGPEEVKKCSGKVIERNENIWEFVSIEYSHFRLLVNIQDVYCKSYPYLEGGSNQSTSRTPLNTRSDSTESRSFSIAESKERSTNLFESVDILLPGIDRLIEYHAKICDCLLNNHLIRPDRVITEIGRVLHESIPDSFIPIIAELYGCINFSKQYINQKLSLFKKYPVFLSYIHKCERDPRCDKKTLADILLHISIHWSKKVTTLNSIISNTINDSQDLNNLIKFKEKIDKIVNEASNVMDNLMNSKLLQNIVENYEPCIDIEESNDIRRFMTAPKAKLIYNGKVQFELKKSNNGKLVTRDVQGVALEECIFFLQIINEPGKTSPKYQLFKERDSDFPAILEWGKLYGYFREEDSKNNDAFSFYVIIEKPSPSIKRLLVGTPQDRSYWKKCMMRGFSLWQSETSQIKDADDQLKEEMKKIDKKWINTQFGIDLIKNLDNALKVQLEYRTVGFQCILEEELKRLMVGNNLAKRNSSNSVSTVTDNDLKKDELDCGNTCLDTYLPDLTTREGINDWLEMFLEWVNRLKFSLCSSGANITRSASEIEARNRRSIPTVKKYDTFTSSSSPAYDKPPVDGSLYNPPIIKKKDQRRISVSGFTNLFRSNNKGKVDDVDKTNDQISPTDINVECEIDNMTISNSEIVSENDCFLSCLSKDTVAAFNEINIAAKNITVELLNLRTRNLTLDATIKKIQEENQILKEFQRKFIKNEKDAQAGLLSGNNSHKNEPVNNSTASLGLHNTKNSEVSPDASEAINDNSSGYAHSNQQMVECRRQTEYLRQKYEEFAKEKKTWEKEYEAQRRKIENEKENLFQKKMDLQKEKDILSEKEKKYADDCTNLQIKYDRIANLEEELRLKLENQKADNNKIPQSYRESIVPLGTASPPIAFTEATLYNSEQGVRNTDQNIPDQLKGSLINQSSINNQYTVHNNPSHKHSNQRSLKSNSSDNNLENRGNISSIYGGTPRLTPSVERKEMYSNSNTCFVMDDKEGKHSSSDFDDKESLFKKPVVKASSLSEHSKYEQKIPNINHTKSDVADNKMPTLGIPFDLAAKTKVKKEKSKRLKFM